MAKKSKIESVKVLSVRQPWASLIAAGIKDVENRTWSTPYRGILYIHASQRFDRDGYDFQAESSEVIFGCPPDDILRSPGEFIRGALIARVVVRDVIMYDESIEDQLSPWHDEDAYGWYLVDPEQVEPIELKGRLGLFSVDLDPNQVEIWNPEEED